MSVKSVAKKTTIPPSLWIAAGGALIVAGLFAGRKRVQALLNGSKLEGLHPKAKERFTAFLTEVQNRLGYSVYITSGYRTQQRQAALQKGNKYAVSAGTSPHVYGLGIDANFSKDGRALTSKTSPNDWEASGIPALARRYGMRWGGDFASRDVVHFDYGWSPALAQSKLKEAKARFGETGWFTADLRQIV